MADITMCANADQCPLRHRCRRYLAKPSEFHQSWANFYQPGQPCQHFYKHC